MFINPNPNYFLTVARERSITRAAEKLYITQPSLSQHISRLEKELGVRLFDRTKNPIAITEAGQIYKRYLESNSYLYLKLLADLNNDRLQKVDMGVGTWRGSILLPRILPDFLKDNPETQVRLHEYPISEQLSRLEDGQTDFAIMNMALADVPRGITCENIITERILLTISSAHPMAAALQEAAEGGGAPDLRLLENERFISLDSRQSVGRCLENYMEQNRLAFPDQLQTSNNRTLLRLTAAGAGFCFLVETGLADTGMEGLLTFDMHTPDLEIPLVFLYKTNAYLSPAAQDLMERIRAYYKENYPSAG